MRPMKDRRDDILVAACRDQQEFSERELPFTFTKHCLAALSLAVWPGKNNYTAFVVGGTGGAGRHEQGRGQREPVFGSVQPSTLVVPFSWPLAACRRPTLPWPSLAGGCARVDMSGPVVSTSRRRALPSIMAWANRLTSFVPPPPAAEDDAKDRVVVVQVHPNGRGPSFTLALGEAVRDSLKAAGLCVDRLIAGKAWGFVSQKAATGMCSALSLVQRVVPCSVAGSRGPTK